MCRSATIARDGVRLVCREWPGSGPPVLLLHGLAGYAGVWSQTAGWHEEIRGLVDALGAGGEVTVAHPHTERLSNSTPHADIGEFVTHMR